MYTDKRNEIGGLADRMMTGLGKLSEASESVAQLSRELAVKEKELAVASDEADQVHETCCIRRNGLFGLSDSFLQVLAEVSVKAQESEKVKSQVQKVKDKAQAIVDNIAVWLRVAADMDVIYSLTTTLSIYFSCRLTKG